jgi:hypothetical protein
MGTMLGQASTKMLYEAPSLSIEEFVTPGHFSGDEYFTHGPRNTETVTAVRAVVRHPRKDPSMIPE